MYVFKPFSLNSRKTSFSCSSNDIPKHETISVNSGGYTCINSSIKCSTHIRYLQKVWSCGPTMTFTVTNCNPGIKATCGSKEGVARGAMPLIVVTNYKIHQMSVMYSQTIHWITLKFCLCYVCIYRSAFRLLSDIVRN